MKNIISHDSCQAALAEKLKSGLKDVFGEETYVENVYFHSDADFKLHMGRRGYGNKEPDDLKHRLLLSFVLPCPLKNPPEQQAPRKPVVECPPVGTPSNAEICNNLLKLATETLERRNAIYTWPPPDIIPTPVPATSNVAPNRVPKPESRVVQVQPHPRPPILMPKTTTPLALPPPPPQPIRPSAVTVGTALRTRKTSPLLSKPTITTTTALVPVGDLKQIKQEIPDIPEGHTYETWILEEGLYKARKLGLHRKTDKDILPFTCPICHKKYRNPNGIKYHAKYAHGPKCIFTCEVCDKTYATRHGLAAHRRCHDSVKMEKQLEREKNRNQKLRLAPALEQPKNRLEASPIIDISNVKTETRDHEEITLPSLLDSMKAEPVTLEFDDIFKGLETFMY